MTPLPLLAWVAAAFLSASLFSHTVALRLMLLFFGTFLALLVVARHRHSIRILPAIWIPFALWAAWAALSLVWSIEPARSVKEWRNEIFYCGLALWICFVGAQSRNAVRVFLPCVALGATAAIAIALRDFSISWERYLVGLHGGPGDHSSALLTLMPCLAMAGWYARRNRSALLLQVLIVGLGLLFPLSAYATLNRTIWLGFAVQFILLGVLLLLRRARSSGMVWSTRAKIVATIAAVAIVGATSGALLSVQEEREATGGTSLEQDHRLLLWPEIIELIQERPLTGYGFGRGLLRGPLREEFGNIDRHLWHAHNLFLEAPLQLGLPGLLLLVLLLGTLLSRGWRLACETDEFKAACGIALVGVVAGMVVRNMTDTLLVRQNALLFWGVIGVLLAWGSRAPRIRESST